MKSNLLRSMMLSSTPHPRATSGGAFSPQNPTKLTRKVRSVKRAPIGGRRGKRRVRGL